MFITFEGIEGSGKTTAQRLLALELEKRGHDVLLTREPGGCGLGRALRPILLDARNSGLCNRAELYLFLADRAQHVAEIIRPAVEAGQIVICDRYTDSTLAYQGYGRGRDPDRLRRANDLATGGLQPDLTLLCDLPVSVGLERAGLRNRREGTVLSEGRFDSESLNFHERVRQGHHRRIATARGRGAAMPLRRGAASEAARQRAGIRRKDIAMSELYTVTAEEGRLRFLPRTDAALEQAVLDESPLPGCEFVSRLGDPGLLHCVVFRHEQKPGGVFVVEDDNGLLFAAVAETNLAYAMALGRLGKMISYARYSADIFAENMLDDDD